MFLTSGGNVLSAGQQVQLTAEARYSDERTVDVTSAATWRSENVAVATVVGGLVTGVAGGNVNIVATFEGASGTISIAVRIPSAT